ncbi:MAG: GGDEF domain-containing protein [Rhizobiaceae bacterium]
MTNSLLLFAEAVVYFGLMAGLFRLRRRIGVGVFMCALGVMHFLETYLASVFYVGVPFGMLSPGSTVLFSGKLVILLLLYIKEDAATVRQPIYGLFIGNLLTIALVLVIRFHEIEALPSGQRPDMAFIDEMGWLMVWGTTLLFVDAILIILLYERLGRVFRNALFPRILASTAAILTLDQVGFYVGLRIVSGAPLDVLFGGWLGKMVAALAYSTMLTFYLRRFERERLPAPRELADVFDMLTFRERYEALVERAGRDDLTGLMHRGRFDELGEQAVAASDRSDTPLTLLIIDVDHFKSINDRFGHAEGDRVLKGMADQLARAVGPDHKLFRIGGEEFAVLCEYPHALGRLLGENIRQTVKLGGATGPVPYTVSVGVATREDGIASLPELFAVADRRLYAAKAAGRDRVVGDSVERQGDRRHA